MDYVLRNLRFVVLLAAAHSLVYGALNRWPPFPPRQLPLTALDRHVPFWAWTVWGYFLLIAMAILLPLLIRDRRIFQRLVVAYIVAMGTAVLFFTFVPTTYPRPDLPAGPSLSDAAYRLLTSIDTPLCCFPSAHILVPVLACAGLWQDGRRGGIWPPLMLGVCTLSILTTKQHYAWDLGGGLAAALLGIVVSGWILSRKSRKATSSTDEDWATTAPQPRFLRTRRSKHERQLPPKHPESHVLP